MKNIIEAIQEATLALNRVNDTKKVAVVDQINKLSKKLMDHIIRLEKIPSDFNKTIFPSVIAQLQAAERRTEMAADTIMTAAEAISKSMSSISGNGKTTIAGETNVIFEASAFQDLVAQHLNEVKLLMNDLRADMLDLSDAISSKSGSETSGTNRPLKRSDAHLLNGPRTDF